MGALSDAAGFVVNAERQKGLDMQAQVDTQRTRAWQDETRAQQRKQWAEEDKVRDRTNAANAAGAAYLDGRRSEWAKGSLGGEFQPSQDDILGALQARGRALYKAGDMDGYLENHARAAGLRASARQKGITDAIQRYGVDQDPVALLRGASQYVDNGFDFVSGQAIKGPDGKPMVRATFRTPQGQQTRDIDPAAVLTQAQRLLANPAEVAKTELQADLARLKGQEERETATHKHGLSLAQIRAEGAESRRTKTTPTASDNNFTLGEGQVRFGRDKDGKTVEVARGQPKTLGSTATSAESKVLLERDHTAKAIAAIEKSALEPEEKTERIKEITTVFERRTGKSFKTK